MRRLLLGAEAPSKKIVKCAERKLLLYCRGRTPPPRADGRAPSRCVIRIYLYIKYTRAWIIPLGLAGSCATITVTYWNIKKIDRLAILATLPSMRCTDHYLQHPPGPQTDYLVAVTQSILSRQLASRIPAQYIYLKEQPAVYIPLRCTGGSPGVMQNKKRVPY